jgi:hypothetical protein
MSDKYNINNYNHVKVEKLGGSSISKQEPSTPPQQPSILPQQETVRTYEGNLQNDGLTKVKSVEYTDSSDDEFDDDEITTGSDLGTDNSDNESTASTVSETESRNNSGAFIGGKRNSDTDSVSSVSTTEILSKDPLFLVLSEFLMDNETGDNIVNVGNNIVTVLSKINSKLGRIADVLEKKHKSSKKRND